MITSVRLRLDHKDIPSLFSVREVTEARTGGVALRWYISEAADDYLQVEATVAHDIEGLGPDASGIQPPLMSSGGVVVSIMPTGIGCSIGGFAGDAGPATRLLCAAADYVLTNPNAVSASDLIALPDNLVYTEGSMIDEFCEGRLVLELPAANQVGLIIDSSNDALMNHAVNVANAVRAVHGVDIIGYVVTDEPIGTRCVRQYSGAYSGIVENVDALFRASARLVEAGATAIAIAGTIANVPREQYGSHFLGEAPNPVGGAEAIISHLVWHRYRIPAAHAPLVNYHDVELPNAVVDPRSASEFVATSGLASVLMGLHRAPRPWAGRSPVRDVISRSQVVALVAPATALGSRAVIAGHYARIPILAVKDNETILDVTAEKLKLKGVLEVDHYAEAAGIVLALREGIDIGALYRPFRGVDELVGHADSDNSPVTPVAEIEGWPSGGGERQRAVNPKGRPGE